MPHFLHRSTHLAKGPDAERLAEAVIGEEELGALGAIPRSSGLRRVIGCRGSVGVAETLARHGAAESGARKTSMSKIDRQKVVSQAVETMKTA
jgi:hypothetical protein